MGVPTPLDYRSITLDFYYTAVYIMAYSITNALSMTKSNVI